MTSIAYADPPYIGQAKKHYSHDPQCAEVDHKILIEDLEANHDGWALSLSVPSLSEVLSYCPKGIRVCAWVKPFASFKKNVTLAYAWEPVIIKPARNFPTTEPTARDWIAENITLKKGLSGAKPERFCLWLFRALGATKEDTFFDKFPGTGVVSDTWNRFVSGELALDIGGPRK